MADDRAAPQEEIDRPRRENKTLREAAGRPAKPGLPQLRLPSEEGIGKAMMLSEAMTWRMLLIFREERQRKL